MDKAKYISKVSVTCLLLALLGWGSYQLLRLTGAGFYAWLGQNRLEAGAVDQAYYYNKKSLNIDSSRSEYYYQLGQSLYGIGQESEDQVVVRVFMEQARQAYKKAAELNPLEGNVWLGLAQASWWLTRLKTPGVKAEEVESEFLKTLSLDPASPVYLYAVVSYFLSADEVAKGLPYVERLAEVLPFAYNYVTQHPHWSPAAREWFRKGLRAAVLGNGDKRQALNYLAEMAAEDKDWAQAAENMKALIDRFGPTSGVYAFIKLGWYYFELNKLDLAEKNILKGLQLSSDRHKTLADVIRQFHKNIDAVFLEKIVRRTAEFDSRVAGNLPLFLGKVYLASGDLAAAEQALKRSIGGKETAEAHGLLAEIALRKKDWDTAEVESHKAIALDRRNYNYYYQFAWSLYHQDKGQAALEAMNQAVKYAQGRWAYVYYSQGLIYRKLERWPEAIQAFKAANRIEPQNSAYLAEIARACQAAKDFAAAERYYLEALKIKPKDQDLQQALAELKKYKSEAGPGKAN